jgi:sugar lactone lactonase YvrE
VQFVIASGSGYTVGSPGSATVSLVDDDGPPGGGGSGGGDGGGDDGGCSTSTGSTGVLVLLFAVLALRLALAGARRFRPTGKFLVVVLGCTLLVASACDKEKEDKGGGNGGGTPAPPVLPEIDTATLADGEINLPYTGQIHAFGGAAPYSWAVTGGALPTGLVLSDIGTPATTLSGIPSSTGTFNFEVTLTDADSNTDARSFTVTINYPPLVITTGSLPDTSESATYNRAVAATGGTGSGYQWQIVAGSLPPGLTIGAAGTPDTLISGTASTAGTYVFTVQVTDSASSATTAELSITVHDPVLITSAPPTGGMQGTQYNHTFTVSGGFGNYTWSHAAGPMPPGLSLSMTAQPSAMLVGTPTTVGSYTFTVRVAESGGNTFDLQTCMVQIVPPIVITTTTLPAGMSAAAYSEDIFATGGTGSGYAWSVVAGTLPAGLALGPSGSPVQLSGTPTQSGSFNFTVEVMDSNSNTDTQVLSLIVVALIDSVAGNGESVASNAVVRPHGLLVTASGDVLIGSDQALIRSLAPSTTTLAVFAGTGTVGYSGDGGQAVAAEFGRAEQMAMDASGNMFFCDPVNHVVRRIDGTTGVITTIAGDGTSGNSGDGGAATSARLNNPSGIAVSASGDIYISDRNNNRVRVVSAGIIDAFAGTGTGGFSGDNGPATQALLLQPTGLVVDSQGRVVICDSGNNRIRRVQSGTIQTICGIGAEGMAGDGALAINAQVANPTDLLLDSNDHIFFSDRGNHRVRRIDSVSGFISTVAGSGNGWSSGGYSGDGGPAASARLFGPEGLAFNAAGDLLIADNVNSAIRVVDAATLDIDTLVLPAHLIGDGGAATSAIVGGPTGVAHDLQGNLLIAAAGRIRRVDATTGDISTIAGTDYMGFSGDGGPATAAMISATGGLRVDAQGNIYFADVHNHRIRRIDASSGFVTTVAGSGPAGSSAGGFAGDGGQATSALLHAPRDLALDASGNLYIADSGNNRIRFVDISTGVITTFAGTGFAGFGGDAGQAVAAHLRNPEGICLHPGGFLVIADSFNNRVRAVDLGTGVINTWAGTGTGGFSGDGNAASNARLSSPRRVTVDTAGNVCVSDSSNDRIRRFAQGGTIATVAGGGGSLGDGGAGTSAQLDLPLGLHIDSNGDMLIADAVHCRVRILYSP